MFSGIIEEVGVISKLEVFDTSRTITVSCKKVLEDLELGDSVSVNGVCLTVTQLESKFFIADIVNETLLKTTLGDLKAECRVNLERAMRYNQRVGGHLVQGHVDTTAELIMINKTDQWTEITLEIQSEFIKYCIYKGSIAIDGVSLTIAEIEKNNIKIALIPHTLDLTILSDYQVGDKVNIETDMNAKYIEKLYGKTN